MATRNSPHLRLTPQAGRRIRIYRNGDAHHKGITIVMNARQVHDINAFLDAVNEKIGLVLGAKRLFTLDGMPVKSTEQLEHNKEYVAASGPFTPLPYGQQQSSAAFRPSPVAMARRGSSSAIGSRFSRPSEEDAFALSSASKKSAPASLAHPALRQSRSTEPRKGQQRIVSSTVANNRPKRDKSTDGSKETKKKGIAVKGVPAAGESKKRGKKKAREEDKLVGSPPTPPPVHLPVDEPKGEEAEEEEESPIRGSPIERTRTEVEVVGHDEPAEEQQEEEEEAEEVAEVEEGEVEEKHVEEEEEEAENDEKGEEAEAKEEHEEKAKEESGEEAREEEKEGEQHHEHHNHRKSVEELEAAEQHHNPTN